MKAIFSLIDIVLHIIMVTGNVLDIVCNAHHCVFFEFTALLSYLVHALG